MHSIVFAFLITMISLVLGHSAWAQASNSCSVSIDSVYSTISNAMTPAELGAGTHSKALTTTELGANNTTKVLTPTELESSTTSTALTLAELDVQWQSVTLPDIWTQRWPKHSGVTWYRIDWQAPCHNEHKQAELPLALLLTSINMAGSIWINDHLLWADPHQVEPLSRSWNSPRYLTIPSNVLRPNKTNHLYIRVVGDALTSPGLGPIEIADIHTITASYTQANWNQRIIYYLNIIFSITLGMMCACIWLLRRQELAYGWYTLASIFWVGFIANTLITETVPFANTLDFTKFNIILFLGYTFCFGLFSWRFLNKRFPRVEKTFLNLALLLCVIIWIIPASFAHQILLFVFYTSIIIFSCNSIFVSYLCVQTRQVELWLLAFTLISCLVLSSVSILSLFHLLGNISIVLPYTSLVFAIFLSIVLAIRLTQSLQRIEGFNEELNQKIIEAEHALESTLNNRHQLSIRNNQLKERLNLAHELHDGLGSSIVRSMLEVSNTKQSLSNKQTLSILSLLRNDLRQIIDSFSESHTKLPDNPIFWLAPLRNRFIQLFDDMDIKLHWEVDSEWIQAPSALQCLTLYRVAEEALTNIIKHSQATEVIFRCIIKPEEMELNIIDNGVGFKVDDIMRSGISVGMNSMQQRLERLSARLAISSEPGLTQIIIHSPYASLATQKV